MNRPLLLVDTDVIVDFLRGNRKAIKFIKKNTDRIVLSVICIAELFAGVRNSEEEKVLTEFVNLFPRHSITYPIAVRAGILKRNFAPSHGIGLADALIAATCEFEKLVLITFNKRHYPMITRIHIPFQK